MADCNVSVVNGPLGIQATGPRTVIVPADPIIWDENTSYEYLTLVASTDFGQGYVSKRDVPSGTPLTNTEYWVPVASFNAQLAAIQAQLNNTAPKQHASETTEYGGGTETNFGHVKVTDGATGSASDSTAISPSGVVAYFGSFWRERSIEEYGCDSGADDNSTALATAFADASENGIPLVIPNKTYKFTSPVDLKNHVQMRGADKNESVLQFSSNSGLVVSTPDTEIVPGKSYYIRGAVNFSDFTIAGPNSELYSATTDVSDSSSVLNNPEINCGIGGGFFFGSLFDNLFIKNFNIGFSVNRNPAGADYETGNRWAGDVRLYHNLSTLNTRICGFYLTSNDIFLDKFNAQYALRAIMATGSIEMNDIHVSGINFGNTTSKSSWQAPCIQMAGGTASNIAVGGIAATFFSKAGNTSAAAVSNLYVANFTCFPSPTSSAYGPLIYIDGGCKIDGVIHNGDIKGGVFGYANTNSCVNASIVVANDCTISSNATTATVGKGGYLIGTGLSVGSYTGYNKWVTN